MIDRETLKRFRVPIALVAAMAIVTMLWSVLRDGPAAQPPEEHAEEGDSAAAAGVVQLDTAAITAGGIRIGTVEEVRTSTLPVTGTITYDQNRVSHIGPRTGGRIQVLRADLGSRVRAGQVLAVLESPEVGATRADLREAEQLVQIARENHDREQRLEAQGISSRKEVLEAEAELRRAQAAALRAAERLRALGAGEGEGGQFVITAPFNGVVVEKHATRGEVAESSDQLFTIADLSRVWIELDIFERDLQRVKVGQPVTVTSAAFPTPFDGHIVYLGDIVDPQRRTVRARVEIHNASGALRPGMFAKADIQLDESGAAALAVPQQAVQEIGGRKVVFLPGVQPGEFRATAVELGDPLPDGRVRVLTGLAAGDRIVIEGAFLLRSELAKGEIGEHGH